MAGENIASLSERITLKTLVSEYEAQRREVLLPKVDTSSFDQRDEDLYDDARRDVDQQIADELRDVTRPKHTIERGFFWGCLGFLLAGLFVPDNSGAIAGDFELALIGGGVGALVGLCVRYTRPG